MTNQDIDNIKLNGTDEEIITVVDYLLTHKETAEQYWGEEPYKYIYTCSDNTEYPDRDINGVWNRHWMYCVKILVICTNEMKVVNFKNL